MKLIRIFLFVSLVLTSLLYTSAQASPAGSALLLDTATPTPAPELLAPAQGSTPELIRPVFDWVNMPGATSYNIVISSYPSFIYPIVDLTPAASTYTALEDLPRDVTLYWRVRMISPTFGPWISSYFTSPNPPYSPAPLTPGLNAIVTDYTPTLTWAASIIPDGTTLAFYKLQVDNNQDFSSPMVDNSGLDPAYTFPSDLTPNSSYYWRVRAANMLGQYSMWRTSSFNTALLPPTLISPASMEVPNSLRPTLDWSDVPGATSYNIVVSSYPSFIYPIIDLTPSTSMYTPTMDLPRNIVLYWRVRVISPYFSVWTSSSFRTPNPPYSPAPLSPGLNALVTDYNPTLTWAASIIPNGTTFAFYQLQVDDTKDFSSLILNRKETNSLNRAYMFPNNLLPNSSYYWRIRTANTLGQYSMWRMSSFRTALLPPVLLSPAFQSVTSSLRPTLDWSDVPGASGYGLVVSTHSDFSSPLVNLAVTASTYLPTADLPPNTLIYWRVRTQGTNISAWSSSSFTSLNLAPATATPSRTPTATINPLGQLYQSLAYGFKFSYLNDATLVSDSGTDIRINLTFVPGTNLGEKYMETRVGDATAGPCQSSEPGKTSSFTEVINGISFLHEEGQDQAAGNIYDWVSYSTVRGSVCVNMLFVLHSGNPANYFPTPPPLFDKAAESQVFGQIVRTFAWLAPTATPTPTLTPTATP